MFKPRLLLLASACFALSTMAAAEDGVPKYCPLFLQQVHAARDEQELAVELAASQRKASEAIFVLVDKLWSGQAVERILHLMAKHDRDLADLDWARQQLLLERAEAEVEHYEALCAPASPQGGGERGKRRDEAVRRYARADCQRIGKDLAIAEVDRAYFKEVLASVHDLRKGDVATQQDVIRAERDVEMAEKRVERQGKRVKECGGEGQAAPPR